MNRPTEEERQIVTDDGLIARIEAAESGECVAYFTRWARKPGGGWNVSIEGEKFEMTWAE